jgi:hypothetical protein
MEGEARQAKLDKERGRYAGRASKEDNTSCFRSGRVGITRCAGTGRELRKQSQSGIYSETHSQGETSRQVVAGSQGEA